jgi:hypothetical protein
MALEGNRAPLYGANKAQQFTGATKRNRPKESFGLCVQQSAAGHYLRTLTMKQYKSSTPLAAFAIAALATFIAVGLLAGVAFLFQRDGAPIEQLAAAERACTQHIYVSERDACMREWLAARAPNVASK